MLFGNASLELGEGCGKTIFQDFEINNMINFTLFEIKILGAKVLNSENQSLIKKILMRLQILILNQNLSHRLTMWPMGLIVYCGRRGGGYSEFCLPFLYVSGDCTMTPFLFPVMSV